MAKTKDTNATPELVKLEVIKQFYDKTLIKDGKKKPEHIRKATTIFEATEERAKELEDKGFVKRLK